MTKIIPAILTNKEEEYHKQLLAAEHVSDLIQVDIIDGKFADNKTIDIDVLKKYPSSSLIEVQLMVEYPQNYIDNLMFVEHVSRIIVPYETGGGLEEAIYHIKNHNKQAGLSLNPDTPVHAAIHLFDDIDLLLLLAVNPGFSGQTFQEKVLDKVKTAKKITQSLPIEIDGGINFENAKRAAEAGADFLAVNSAIYKADDFKLAYEKISTLVSNE